MNDQTFAQNVEYVNSILWTEVNDVKVVDTLAYCAFANGLVILDVSNLASPAFVSKYYTQGHTNALDVSGSYAYLADNEYGLQIIEVSNPSAPLLAGSYNTPGSATGVYVSGSYAYVADYSSGLQIIDISNPSSPDSVGSYDTPGYAEGVYVSGDYAYMADGSYGGLQIIDVSIPSSPDSVGSYDTPGSAHGIYVSGDYAYVADRNSLMILWFDSTMLFIDDPEPSLPKELILLQNYPNPFNPATMIKYDLPIASDVTIEIYDILGRKAATLIREKQQAGYHHIVWNADSFSSGMYFYRIQAGDYSETKKMVLLK